MRVRVLCTVFLLGLIGLVLGCSGKEKVTTLAPAPKPQPVAVVTIRQPPSATAINRSTPTKCAEEDNVNIPLVGKNVTSFMIEATHPLYDTTGGSSAPDFTGQSGLKSKDYRFTAGVYEMYNDEETIVEAVREAQWWRPRGMTVCVDDSSPIGDIHYIRLYRVTAKGDSWPQFFVLYSDANVRVKPQPKGSEDNCFGSSVVVGPAEISKRPIAEIAYVKFNPGSQSLEVKYRSGASARITIREVDSEIASLKVDIKNNNPKLAFATFRSMFVSEGNADVDHVESISGSGSARDFPVMKYQGGQFQDWFFHRTVKSGHNTSAPNIRIQTL
jgi:hypothetical protein